MSSKYDLIVIGSGSGGLGIATGMLELDFKVLLVDKSSEKIGGECLNTGCVPSKALLHIAKEIYQARQAHDYGLKVTGEVNIEKVWNSVTKRQEKIREHENAEYLRRKGMEVILGVASFHNKNSVKINGKIFKARKIVIATGSSPRKLNIKGLENIPSFTNENIFEIDFIPKNFVFLGAGPVSIEIAQAFARLGSKVTVVHRGKHILKREDPYIREVLLKKLKEESIEFLFETEVKSITEEKKLELKTNNNKENSSIAADAIFFGIGRELDFSSLDLEKARIKLKDGKIAINKKLQTSNKKIFVSGDATDSMKFSHAAEMHNMLLLNNFFSPLKKKLSFEKFSWVTFTDPELATFGLNEQELNNRNKKYERLELNFEEADRAITDNYGYGRILLFIEKKKINARSAKILGGSMVAPKAGEICQELILANSAEISVNNILNKIYPYPTATNINKIILRKRMLKDVKPWLKKFLQFLYKI